MDVKCHASGLRWGHVEGRETRAFPGLGLGLLRKLATPQRASLTRTARSAEAPCLPCFSPDQERHQKSAQDRIGLSPAVRRAALAASKHRTTPQRQAHSDAATPARRVQPQPTYRVASPAAKLLSSALRPLQRVSSPSASPRVGASRLSHPGQVWRTRGAEPATPETPIRGAVADEEPPSSAQQETRSTSRVVVTGSTGDVANHGRLGQSEGSAQPAECRWTAQGSGVESGPYGILRWASAGWVASAQGSGAAAPAPVYSSTDLVAVSLGPCQHAGEPKAAACEDCIAALEGACAAAAGGGA